MRVFTHRTGLPHTSLFLLIFNGMQYPDAGGKGRLPIDRLHPERLVFSCPTPHSETF